jgi:long-chain acyl-CoA synthetase
MTNLSPELRDKILRAQSVDGMPPTARMVSYRNIGDLLQQQADRHEQKTFLVFFDEEGHRTEYSYREFADEVAKTANFLVKMGIGHGDRVATLSHNHSDTVIQYFAAFLLGAVVVPINAGEDDRRIAYILQNSGARLAFVRDSFMDRIKAIHQEVSSLETIVKTGGTFDPPHPDFAREVARQRSQFTPPREPGPEDEALIVYTSGTTGNPKGVVLLQYNLLVDAMAIAEWHMISEDQRMMCVLPIHHVNGIVVTLMTPLYAGAGIVLNQKFHSDRFFDRIGSEKVHVVSVVPTILQFLLHANLSTDGIPLGHFRHIICGAGPLTVDLAMKFEKRFQIPIVHGYGLSETTCYSCFLPIDLSSSERRHWLSKHGFPSIGVPLPVNEMAIHDGDGRDMDEGMRGEIVIRGHNVMKYYFMNEEANASTFAHGWFRSGDEGFFLYDDQGRKFFFITGRLKEIIIRGGVNISPFEIDEILMHIPGVQAGIAVGFDNDWYGEEVGAYVHLKDGVEVSEEQILAACRRLLPFSKSPKVVVFGNNIPVTSTGKYQRNRCKELFAQWKTTQFSGDK